MSRARIFLILVSCVAAPSAAVVVAAPLSARDLSVQSAVSSKRPFVGEPVVLELTVRQSTAKMPEIDDSQRDAFGAKLKGEPSRSQFRQSINGVVTEEIIFQFRYQFVPQRAGPMTIPAVTVRQGKETATTDPVEIEAIAQDWAFVEIAASDRTVYPGQTITLTVQILLRRLIHEETLLDNDPFGGREPPQLRIPWLGGVEMLEASKTLGDSLKKRAKDEGPSFAVNDLFQRTNLLTFFDERVSQDGIRFDRDEVQRVGLDGQKYSYYRYSLPLEYRVTRPGSIGPLIAQLRGPIFTSVHREGRELVADRRDVATVSPPITLTVLNVPKVGQPETFTGGVGSFKIAASAQPTSVRIGDPITLTVRVTGSGTIEDTGQPNLAVQEKWTTNFKVHEDASQRMEEEAKIFTYSVRPRTAEVKELPAIKLSFFNPKLKKYEDTYTERVPLTVSETAMLDPSEIVEAAPATKGNRALEELGGGLAPNYTGLEVLDPQGPYSIPAIGWCVGILSPPLIWLAAFALHTRVIRRRQNPGLLRARAAQRSAMQRLDAAADGPALLVPNEVAHALAGYLADRLDLPSGELTPAEALHRSSLLGARLSLAEQTSELVERCDQARFARSASHSVAEELLKTARDIICELERTESSLSQDRPNSNFAASQTFILCWIVIVLSFTHMATAADRVEAVDLLTQGLVCLAVVTGLGLSVQIQSRDEHEHPLGVLIAEEVVRKGNGETYEPQFDRPLGPGVEVRVLERRSEWKQIELVDGKLGWVRSSHVETIRD